MSKDCQILPYGLQAIIYHHCSISIVALIMTSNPQQQQSTSGNTEEPWHVVIAYRNSEWQCTNPGCTHKPPGPSHPIVVRSDTPISQSNPFPTNPRAYHLRKIPDPSSLGYSFYPCGVRSQSQSVTEEYIRWCEMSDQDSDCAWQRLGTESQGNSSMVG